MTMTFDEGKPSPADALHYGKKGMKWGVRKTHITTDDIKTARKRIGAIDRKAMDAEDRTVLGKTPAARAKAQKEFEALEKQFRDSPDRSVAMRLTRGEKAATILLGGPVGLIVVGANAGIARSIEKRQQKRMNAPKK